MEEFWKKMFKFEILDTLIFYVYHFWKIWKKIIFFSVMWLKRRQCAVAVFFVVWEIWGLVCSTALESSVLSSCYVALWGLALLRAGPDHLTSHLLMPNCFLSISVLLFYSYCCHHRYTFKHIYRKMKVYCVYLHFFFKFFIVSYVETLKQTMKQMDMFILCINFETFQRCLQEMWLTLFLRWVLVKSQ